MTAAELLHLHARAGEDVPVFSACLQDALLRIGDIHWTCSNRRLTLLCNRFCWESVAAGQQPKRVLALVEFAGVLSVRQRGLACEDKNTLLEVLALNFVPAAEPGGRVNLLLAGGGVLALEVEMLDVRLRDVSPSWQTSALPGHDKNHGQSDRQSDGQDDGQ